MDALKIAELPDPIRTPIDPGMRFAALPGPTGSLARHVLTAENVYHVVRTRTRVDVGSWLGGSRVTLFVVDDGLVLLAPARNPLVWMLGASGSKTGERSDDRDHAAAPTPDEATPRELANRLRDPHEDPLTSPAARPGTRDEGESVDPDNEILQIGPPREYLQRVPYTDLNESTYNHVTGQLVLAPAEGLRARMLTVEPLDGYQVLAQIYR